MALIKKFTPQNSDQFVGKDQGDHTLAKFGHLNYILRNITIQIGNVTIPAGYVIGPGPGNDVTNTAFGYTALDSRTSGTNNVAIGYNALTASTVTNFNVAVGANALAAHTAAGNGNSVAIGYNALGTKTGLSDSNNVAVGALAMSDGGGTGGNQNIAVGVQALRNNNGNRNTSIGYQSMRFNLTGGNNTTIGYQGLYNTTGSRNVSIGYLSGYLITTGSNNVVIGGNNGSSINTLSNFMLFADGLGNERFRVDDGARMGIGATSINPSAKVQIDSTVQGLLPPRMTTAQKNAIASPAAGLIVYDTTTNKLCCFNGTIWNDLF